MSLRTLVESLRSISPDELRGFRQEQIVSREVAGRVNYPPDWENVGIELHRASGGATGCNLRLSGDGKPSEELTPLLTTLLDRSRRQRFEPGAFEVETEVEWPVEAFSQEFDLADLTRVEVRSSFWTCDTTKVRIGFPSQRHELKIELAGRRMTITASGDYSSLLPRLIAALKPQIATIRLSEADAKRWLSKTRGLQKWVLGKQLQPQRRTVLSLEVGGGPSFSEQDDIEVSVSTRLLSACAEAIGRPIINEVTGEETFLVNLTRLFTRPGQILPALQAAVQIIGELETQTVFGHPMLTTEGAKELLEKEITLIQRSYQEWCMFGLNTHLIRGPVVKRLVREHFGDDILVPFDEMDPPSYLAFLKSRGFVYNGALDKKHDPPYQLKEQYLLAFFVQSFASDPRDSIERFRQSYVNAPPRLEITGVAKQDASRMAKLSLPARALLTGFSLRERSRQGDNEMIVRRDYRDQVHFWARVSLDSCRLLDLQEEACQRLGVTCD